jgi:hypothetical protein
MQSIVNMKLLKRAAENAKKHIVLVTSEAGLLPLAGAVGMHVAKTPQSRPEVPPAPDGNPVDDIDDEAVSMAGAAGAVDPQLDRTRPIGAFAGAAATKRMEEDGEETIDFDNAKAEEKPLGVAAAGAAAKAGKKDSKFRIPDFNKFRVLIISGVAALIAILIFGYFAVAVMPKATVIVKTDSEAIDTNIDVALDIDADSVDTEDFVAPATEQTTTKTSTQTVDATGSTNKGERAQGQITLTNCSFFPTTLAAGTGFSANGLTFISQKAVTIPASDYSASGGGLKCKNDGKANVDVVAQKPGAAYNLAAQGYTIANSPDNVKAAGGAMTGGTDNIIKTVTQGDIDGAKEKITSQDNDAIETELSHSLETKRLYAITDSLKVKGESVVTTDVAVGAEAEKVTITQKTTYVMLGVAEKDLKKLIEHEVNQKIDTKRQSILDYGLDDAFFKIQNQEAENAVVTMQVTSVAGSDLNLEDIKKQIAGLKANDAKESIGKYPGVTQVDVKYSPFWVKSIPKKTDKITLTIEKPKVQDANN